MVPVNKDTLLIVAAIVFAIGMIYMFKELNKAKQDIDNFKGFSAQVVRHLAPPPEPVSVQFLYLKRSLKISMRWMKNPKNNHIHLL